MDFKITHAPPVPMRAARANSIRLCLSDFDGVAQSIAQRLTVRRDDRAELTQ
jgi:hypothetical protein